MNKINRIEKGIIKKVTEDDTHFYIDIEGSWRFGLSKEYGVKPKIGDAITIYTVNFSTIRGVEINNIQVYYKSDEQLEQEHKDWCENYEKEKQEAFEKDKAQMDADYEALPDNFKKRIDRFRNNNPKFRVDFERDELFCCKEALKIAGVCKTQEDVMKFHDLGFEEQIKILPTLSDDHSGNTFGCACMLARFQLECPDKVSEMHGSLSPLVGSKDFGDIAMEDVPEK